MSPQMSSTDKAQITELPATLAGLWTAITRTHVAAMGGLTDDVDDSAGDLADVVAHCARAADTLAASSQQGILAFDDGPEVPHPAGQGPDLLALSNICIDLAIEVLGNEDEPLTPSEIVAITRAVTSLCAARAATPGVDQ